MSKMDPVSHPIAAGGSSSLSVILKGKAEENGWI